MTKETVFALDDAVIRLQAAQEKAALIASDLDDNYFCWNIDGDKKYYVLAYHDDAATRNRIVLDYLSKIKNEAAKLRSLVNQILAESKKSNAEVKIMNDANKRCEQLKQSITRLLEQADERKLDNIYHFVLHIIK